MTCSPKPAPTAIGNLKPRKSLPPLITDNPFNQGTNLLTKAGLPDISSYDIYSSIDLDSFVTKKFDQKVSTFIYLDGESFIHRIETFVKSCFAESEPLFYFKKTSSGQLNFHQNHKSKLTSHAKLLKTYLFSIGNSKNHNPYVKIFYAACVESGINLLESTNPSWDYILDFSKLSQEQKAVIAPSFKFPVYPSTDLCHQHEESNGQKEFFVVFNNLVELIRQKFKSKVFRQEVSARRNAIHKIENSLATYVQALFQQHDKLHVLRMDLTYKEAPKEPYAAFIPNTKSASPVSPVSLEPMRLDLKKFLNNRRHHTLFTNMVGYIVKLEQNISRGPHLHCMFFFKDAPAHTSNASVPTSYGSMIAQIGQYWCHHITQGLGDFYDCSQHPNSYKRRAIGLMSYNDVAQKNELLYVLSYLAKANQVLRERFDMGKVSLQRGELARSLAQARV